MSDVKHPTLDQFRRAAIEKKDLTPVQRDEFDWWRNNPAKCAPDSPLKTAADALWSEWQAAGSPMRGPARPASPPVPAGRRSAYGGQQRGGPPGRGGPTGRGGTPQAGRDQPAEAAGSARVFGEPFHNPYTFLPFGRPERHPPTPLTIDESEKDRLTGVLELTVRTLSPLLTCDPEPKEQGDHESFRVLAIGNDVIVPATGVRGALRTLLTILTGGTLGYVDDLAWLTQGRDATLGPRGKTQNPDQPKEKFLAQVLMPGGPGRAGRIQLGETRLVSAESLGDVRRDRPSAGERQHRIPVDEHGRRNSNGDWLLRLSGEPINRKGKREGIFRPNGEELELPAELWEAYVGRHRHAMFPELAEGDLVWLEPSDPECTQIRVATDVKSLQWARWGRTGERLLQVLRTLHPEVLPDALRSDGLVDTVTDLFGQVPLEDGAAGPFAARVRPDNLVFRDAVESVRAVALAPLAPPHPGCGAFYRVAQRAADVGESGRGLRGYKVYRRQGAKEPAPWLWSTQGVYDDTGKLKGEKQKVNKTCELLDAEREGTLRIAFRALNRKELALLLAATTTDWRLGGGKSLGLGACRVIRTRVIDETGTVLATVERPGDDLAVLPPDWSAEVTEETRMRLLLWQASQRPVEKLRYPRAVSENRNAHQRGGHTWFQRHAMPKKGGGARQFGRGLQPVWVREELRAAAHSDSIEGQVLPPFDAESPEADVLYGYDVVLRDPEEARNRQKHFARAESFVAAQPAPNRPTPPAAPNRDSRERDKTRRR